MSTRMDSIREAAAQLSGDVDETPADGAPETEISDATDATPAVADAAEAEAETPAKPEPVADTRARDESGKFAKVPKEKAAISAKTKPGELQPGSGKQAPATDPLASAQRRAGAQPQPGDGAAAPTPAPGASKLRPPQSWTPLAREKWNGLPPEIQAEIDKREREASTGLQSHAERAKMAEAYEQVAAPYRPMLGNTPPHQAFAGLLQAQYVLTQGNPDQVARGIAQLINQRQDVPVELISQYLGTAPAQPQGQPQAPAFDPQKFKQEMFQELRQQSVSHRAAQDILKVSGQEFYADVREDMADLIQSATRRGVAMSPEDAYNRAVQLHPEVSKVIAQREAAKRAKAVNASTQRAKSASSSVRSEPASAASGDKPTDRMSMLREAASSLGK